MTDSSMMFPATLFMNFISKKTFSFIMAFERELFKRGDQWFII